MELVSLHIENFGSIGDITFPLNRPGLVLVLGVNKDAPKADNNGSGKTLLFDALCWCLWGETVRGLSGDDVVNRHVGKNCAVKVTITEGDDTFVISRHRRDKRVAKPNDLLVFKNDEPLQAQGKMKTMQAVVDRIVGFNFQTFCAMMPGTGIKAAQMSDSEIKKLLESLLQTEELAAAYDAARARLKELDGKLHLVGTNLTRGQQQVLALQQEQQKLYDLKAQRDQQKAAELQSLAESIDYCKEQLQAKEQFIATHDQLTADQAEVALQLTKLDLVSFDERSVLRAIDAELLRVRADQRVKHSLHEMFRKRLVSLMDDSEATCSACFQPIDKDHRAREVQKAEDLKRQVSDDTQILLREERYYRDLYTYAAQVFTHRQQGASALRQRKNQIDFELAQVEQARKDLPYAEEQVARAQRAYAAAERKVNDFTDLVEQKAASITQLQEMMEQLRGEKSKLDKERKLCDFWVTGFAPAGLRSFMLDYVTPILNSRAEHYARLLTDGELTVEFTTKTQLKNGEVRDKFQVLAAQKNGADNYKGISTGEKARADLVIAMALGDLASFRTAKQLPWRFLDEPFESIDEAGTDAIVRLLNDQKAKYKTVFVVTHKSSFKKLFTQQVLVVKEKGMSRLADAV